MRHYILKPFLFIISLIASTSSLLSVDQEAFFQMVRDVARQSARDTVQEYLARSGGLTSPQENTAEYKKMNSVMAYIPQVVKIFFHIPLFRFGTIDNFLKDIMGTGFIIDAEEGIICTNFHLVPNDARGKLSVVMDDGDEYETPEVEILGTSPGNGFGDFSFIRVRALAKKYPQMPLSEKSITSKRDPVAFVGNSSGNLSVETGLINDPFADDSTNNGFGTQTISVQLASRGGASGSPVFDNDGEIIGVLFASNKIHTSVVPIWYLRTALNQLKQGMSITSHTLGIQLKEEPTHDILRFKWGTREQLAPYTSSNRDEMKRFLMVQALGKRSVDEKLLLDNDIILAVNNTPIGINRIKLAQILMEHDETTVDVLRNGSIQRLTVKTNKIPSTFTDHVRIFSYRFYLANYASADTMFLKANSTFVYSDSTLYTVEAVGEKQISTFKEFIQEMYRLIFINKKRHIRVELSDIGTPHRKFLFMDGPEWVSDIYVDSFNTTAHQWTNVPMSDYA